MRRVLIAAMTFVIAVSAVQGARAVFVDDGAHYMKARVPANKMWPWPYVCADRVAVHEPFCIMVNNGWRRQNLLGPHHFNPNTNQLTTAGELRVQWILTQAPPERRNIFVERTLNQETNDRAIGGRSRLRDQGLDRRPRTAGCRNILDVRRSSGVSRGCNEREFPEEYAGARVARCDLQRVRTITIGSWGGQRCPRNDADLTACTNRRQGCRRKLVREDQPCAMPGSERFPPLFASWD